MSFTTTMSKIRKIVKERTKGKIEQKKIHMKIAPN
jgi:hypothetical protein